MLRASAGRIAGVRGAAVFLLVAAVVLALPSLPPFQEAFRLTQLQLAASMVIIVLGLNLLIGSSGQVSLGHSGFVLVGAYLVGILLTRGVLGYSVPPLIAVVVATVGAGALGFAVGLPALRLSGPYLVIVTLGLAFTVPVLMKWDPLTALTGGATGLVLRQPRPPAGLDWLSNAEWRYYVIAAPALLVGLTMWRLTHSRFGRALVALRDHELAAEQVGVHLARYKTAAFGISAACAGLGGALFSYASLGLVTPDSYGIFESLDYVTAIMVGGVGSVSGSVLGALLVAYRKQIVSYLVGASWTVTLGGSELISIPSPLARLDRPEALGPLVYAVLLILVVLVAPRGVAGLLHDLAGRRSGTRAEAGRRRLLGGLRRPRAVPDLRNS